MSNNHSKTGKTNLFALLFIDMPYVEVDFFPKRVLIVNKMWGLWGLHRLLAIFLMTEQEIQWDHIRMQKLASCRRVQEKTEKNDGCGRCTGSGVVSGWQAWWWLCHGGPLGTLSPCQ